jgi:glycosyltransferase involved in cell wall biosynthesis
MKTVIVIPTYKRPAFLERVLLSLSKCVFPPDVEIHVVENGPRSGAEDICRTHSIEGRVLYLYSPIAGRSKAINHAIRSSSADFFIFFDDDIQVPEDMVTIYVSAAQRYGKGHFFGGPLVPDAETKCPAHLVPHLPRSAIGWSHGKCEVEIAAPDFEFFFGANWAVFKADLERAGLFSEELGVTSDKASPVGEEGELQQRLVAGGAKAVYLPGAVIHHFVPRECYTAQWVWHRNFRLGVTDWIMTYSSLKPRREIFGVPGWILKSAAKQKAKVLASRLFGFPAMRKAEIQMRDAYLSGLVHGARAEHDRARLASA